MPDDVSPAVETPEVRAAESSGIGVDQWVAQSGERRERKGGLFGPINDFWLGLRPSAKLAFIAPAAFFPLLVNEGNLYSYGIFTLIFCLLALGLNVVVGFAGLLDLGYIAFFGFGAYGFSFLSGTHHDKGHIYTHHWQAEFSIPVVVIFCALLGLLLGVTSRRLLGDYLAIVTLFFGQAFFVFANTTDPFGLTGGANGLGNIDPLKFFGRWAIVSNRSLYWFLLGSVAILLVILHLISESRTGRAWRASREDPLSAELMGMPVNRLKIMAFSFGAGVAGFAGCMYAVSQTGAFAGNFKIDLLILIYAVVILGGTGSLAGMVVGAIVINVSYSILASQNAANTGRILFYSVLLLLMVGLWKNKWMAAAALGSTIALGFVVHATAGALWAPATKGHATDGAWLTGAIEHWVVLPAQHTGRIADYAYVLLVVMIIAVTQLKGWWRVAGIAPTMYLTAFVWENLLVENRAVTRLILFGALLIGIMTFRPQGLLGTTKVEVV